MAGHGRNLQRWKKMTEGIKADQQIESLDKVGVGIGRGKMAQEGGSYPRNG